MLSILLEWSFTTLEKTPWLLSDIVKCYMNMFFRSVTKENNFTNIIGLCYISQDSLETSWRQYSKHKQMDRKERTEKWPTRSSDLTVWRLFRCELSDRICKRAPRNLEHLARILGEEIVNVPIICFEMCFRISCGDAIFVETKNGGHFERLLWHCWFVVSQIYPSFLLRIIFLHHPVVCKI